MVVSTTNVETKQQTPASFGSPRIWRPSEHRQPADDMRMIQLEVCAPHLPIGRNGSALATVPRKLRSLLDAPCLKLKQGLMTPLLLPRPWLHSTQPQASRFYVSFVHFKSKDGLPPSLQAELQAKALPKRLGYARVWPQASCPLFRHRDHGTVYQYLHLKNWKICTRLDLCMWALRRLQSATL